MLVEIVRSFLPKPRKCTYLKTQLGLNYYSHHHALNTVCRNCFRNWLPRPKSRQRRKIVNTSKKIQSDRFKVVTCVRQCCCFRFYFCIYFLHISRPIPKCVHSYTHTRTNAYSSFMFSFYPYASLFCSFSFYMCLRSLVVAFFFSFLFVRAINVIDLSASNKIKSHDDCARSILVCVCLWLFVCMCALALHIYFCDITHFALLNGVLPPFGMIKFSQTNFSIHV